MSPWKNRYLLWLAMILMIAAIWIRVPSLVITNYDMEVFNRRWYETLVEEGIFQALGRSFTNYNPPYTYLLALATLGREFLPSLIAIKLIPTIFDVLGMIVIFRITRLRHPSNDLPFLAAAIYFCAPTVILNSSYWGQADSIYTVLLLASVFAFMKERIHLGLAALGFAISVKAQGIFLLPLVGLFVLQKRIPWRLLLIPPLAYLFAVVPVIVLGRSFPETMLIYLNQANFGAKLSANAPNPYYFFSYDMYERVLPYGFLAACIIIPFWVISAAKHRDSVMRHIVLYALISVALTPFVLPKMHDRYFYPADVFSIVYAFFYPGFWFVPILFQITSFLAYSVFLFDVTVDVVIGAAVLTSITLAILLWHQRQVEETKQTHPRNATMLVWAVALLVPFVVFVTCLRFTLTPLYFRGEYGFRYTLDQFQVYTKYDLIKRASLITDYLTTDKEVGYLYRNQFLDGTRMFDEQVLRLLQETKKEIKFVFTIWYGSLILMFLTGLFTWSTNQRKALHQGVKFGGYLAVCLSPFFALLGNSLLSHNQDSSALQIFPMPIWMDMIIFSSILTAVIGALLVHSMQSKIRTNQLNMA